MENCKCCGNCFWFNGNENDGVQFCDELEIYVNAEEIACRKYKAKENEDECVREDFGRN